MGNNFWKPVAKLTFADVEDLKMSGSRERTFLDYKEFDPRNLPLPREKLAQLLSAFANSGGGRVVFGVVEENEQIVKFEGAKKEKNRAIKASIRNAAHSVQPPVDVEVVDVPSPKETLLYVVEVQPGQRGPFQVDGRYLQRAGDGNVAMPHTSVVHAVQAAQQVVLDPNERRLDRPILQNDASDTWRCGVLLSPTYDDRRVLYDPLGPETREIEKLLQGRSYRVARQTLKLRAQHTFGRTLELWKLGHVKVFDLIETTEPTPLEDLVRAWSRFIADAAACLYLIQPMLIVDVELWVWTFDRTPLKIHWGNGSGKVVKEMRENPLPRTDRLHMVADLVGDGTKGRYHGARSIASKAAEYLQLFIEEKDGAF